MDNKFDEDFLDKYADQNEKNKKSDEYEDIYSSDDKSNSHMLSEIMKKEEKTKKGKTKRLTKKQKAVIITLASVLGAMILAVVIVASSYFGKIGSGIEDKFEEPDIVEEDLESIDKINDILDAYSLKDLLKKWAKAGDKNKMSSKNVVNILLLGLDGKSSEEGATRSDVMLLASINKKTKKITFVSFLRDSYTYMNTKKNKEIYTKLTEAYFYGGPDLVVQCIEDDYKIEIDGYVSVNFATFPKVIDALGGVEIDITEKEATYLRSAMKQSGVQSGKGVHINGETALAFCRIRYIDSDNERTRRQRDVLTAIGKKASTASIKQLNNLLDELLPYIGTDLSAGKILSLATQAVSSGWINFEQTQIEMPGEAERRAGYVGTKWFWIVDYQGAAYKLQQALYGTSNITLPDDRITALDLFRDANQSQSQSQTQSSSNVSSTRPSVSETNQREEETTRRQSLLEQWFNEETEVTDVEPEEPTDEEPTEKTTEKSTQQNTENGFATGEDFSWWFEDSQNENF